MLKKFILPVALLLGLFLSCQAPAVNLPDFTGLVEAQGAAVVNVSTTQITRNAHGFPNIPEGDPFLEFFRRFAPQMPQYQESQSLGSGFIISSEGYILTNAHVVESADKITVRLTDKREFSARVIGTDKRTDVALLKIEARNLPKVTMGDPNKLKVGEWVVAIGSPFGFDSSVTAGIVSAKGRALPNENLVPFIQTDVAINPGNSGGPLFNMNGEVVGINSQIYTRSGGSMGLSFAIPIDVAAQVAEQLRTTGKVTRGRLGVTIQEMTRELAESFGLKNSDGALVSGVQKEGAADKAGIEVSDVILKFDGKDVAGSTDLSRSVAATRPGSKVNVVLWRKGALKELTVVVMAIPDEGGVATAVKSPAEGTVRRIDRLGIAVSELSNAQQAELQINGGLLVEEVRGTIAHVAGLQRGDVLLALGNMPILNLNQFDEAIRKFSAGHHVALLVRRGDNASYIAIRLDEK